MENIGRLFSQVAAEAGVTENRAKLAVYLFGLGNQGKTIGQAAALMRRKPSTIKTLARDFMIDFADYRPFAKERDKGADVEPRVKLKLAA